MASRRMTGEKAKPPTNDIHNQSKYRILIQILVSCIDQARQNEQFRYLHKQQQDVILEVVWFECFLLRVACWTIDILPIIDSLNEVSLKTAIAKIKSMQLDYTELNLLETIILCRKEFGISSVAIRQLEMINEGALLSLGRYILQQGHPWPRYGKLLLALRGLGVNFNSGVYAMFKNIIRGVLQ